MLYFDYLNLFSVSIKHFNWRTIVVTDSIACIDVLACDPFNVFGGKFSDLGKISIGCGVVLENLLENHVFANPMAVSVSDTL